MVVRILTQLRLLALLTTTWGSQGGTHTLNRDPGAVGSQSCCLLESRGTFIFLNIDLVRLHPVLVVAMATTANRRARSRPSHTQLAH